MSADRCNDLNLTQVTWRIYFQFFQRSLNIKSEKANYQNESDVLKVHYASFYGPINKQRHRALDIRNSCL